MYLSSSELPIRYSGNYISRRTNSSIKVFISNINSLKQVCYIHMKLHPFDQETSILMPGSIEMMKETELTQYYIKKWQLTYYDTGEK